MVIDWIEAESVQIVQLKLQTLNVATGSRTGSLRDTGPGLVDGETLIGAHEAFAAGGRRRGVVQEWERMAQLLSRNPVHSILRLR